MMRDENCRNASEKINIDQQERFLRRWIDIGHVVNFVKFFFGNFSEKR
jgi:hypothetical protein